MMTLWELDHAQASKSTVQFAADQIRTSQARTDVQTMLVNPTAHGMDMSVT